MKRDPRRLGRGLSLIGVALVIAKLLATGQMVKYMTPALDPLSVLTAVVLAVMGVVELGAAWGPPGEHAPRDGSPDASGHGHGMEEALTHLLIGLVLLVGLVVTPRALDSTGLGGERVAGLILRFAGGPTPSGPRPPTPAGPLDDVGAVLAYLRTASDADTGPRVRVTGTVTRSDDLEPGEFALLRYSIAHCVADARPVALLVVAPGPADGAPWQRWGADQWVEVEGVLAARERAGDRLVTVEATHVRPIEEPGNPYLSAAY